jgi:ketosteroid isomerase-like protein
MNPQKSPEITVQTLLALRKEDDAVRLIAERLGVKEMGPADHIRTKHEVKTFVESGDTDLAERLLTSATERQLVNQRIVIKASQQRSQRM